MASGKRVNLETKQKAIRLYYEGKLTVAEIADRSGVKPRAVYSWIEKTGFGSRQRGPERRKAIKLNKAEAELILLMILETEKDLSGRYQYELKSIENRLLNIADELTIPGGGMQHD